MQHGTTVEILCIVAVVLVTLLMHLLSIHDPIPEDRCSKRDTKIDRRHQWKWHVEKDSLMKRRCRDCGTMRTY